MFTINVLLICIVLYAFFRYKTEQIKKDDWVKFDPSDFRTYPKEGIEVICYISAWDRFYIAYMVCYDGIPKWTDGNEMISGNSQPFVWKYIE